MRRIPFPSRRPGFRILLLSTALSLAAFAAAPAQEGGEAASQTEDVVVLKTNMGDIVLRLFPDVAPAHVDNFLKLARDGVYDGVQFHRVIPGFMIQGGDPNTKNDSRADDGMGGAGPGVPAEFSKIPHRRGILSMARSQNPNSARSQFFIVVSDSAFLDGKYSVFGMVVDGMDVADKIVALPRDQKDNPLPANPAIIEKAVVEQRQLAPRPDWTRP